jgi:hypothetical protein
MVEFTKDNPDEMILVLSRENSGEEIVLNVDSGRPTFSEPRLTELTSTMGIEIEESENPMSLS